MTVILSRGMNRVKEGPGSGEMETTDDTNHFS